MEILTFGLKTAGIGLLSGLMVGFISKKISKIAVIIIASIFILTQIAIFNGYIDIDWLSLKHSALEIVKKTDVPQIQIKEIFLRNIPFSISAFVGFLIGFKKG